MTTLQQIIDSIDPAYPVAGRDNDSQGFRDNFSYIQNALTTANSEVISLQTNAVLTHNVTTNSVVANDLAGSSINNGFYNNFHGVSFNNVATPTTTIDITAGSIQQFTMTADTNFTFHNWPVSGHYAKVRVHLLTDLTGMYTATFYTENGGSIVKEASVPDTISVDNTGKNLVFDAWCFTGSTSKIVYLSYVGEF